MPLAGPDQPMRVLTILGSSGSIGTSTLDVVRRHPAKFRVYGLVAGSNIARLLQQILEFRPRFVAVATEAGWRNLKEKLAESGLRRSEWPELAWGPEGYVAAATAPEVDMVVSAIVGVAGLEATYEAIRRGKRVGLANKETLVAGGPLVMEAVRESGAELIPIDSEHSGLYQCLKAGRHNEIARLILTASGGPFRTTPKEELERVTPEQALCHPTWKMGRRITIDSATLMNKGFEVIEARWLFDVRPEQIQVLIHPQSSVHALVEFRDGSVIAQISTTDMRMPIQYALTYPERSEAPVPRYDWSVPHQWTFEPPDLEKFPLLRLAYEALQAGQAASCALNAADEVAVEAFLQRRLPFPGIAHVVEETLARIPSRPIGTIAEVLELDREARQVAAQLVATYQNRGAARPVLSGRS